MPAHESEAMTERGPDDDPGLGDLPGLPYPGLRGFAAGISVLLLVSGVEAQLWAKASLVFLWQALGAAGLGVLLASRSEPRSSSLKFSALFFLASSLGLAYFWPWSKPDGPSFLLAEIWVMELLLLSGLLTSLLCRLLGQAWGSIVAVLALVGVWLQPLFMSPVLQCLPRDWRAEGLSWVLSTTPLFIVCGSFLGVDMKTSQALYERFAIGQSEASRYAAPRELVEGLFYLVLVLALIWAILRGLERRRPKMGPGLSTKATLLRGIGMLALLSLSLAPARAADEALKLRLTYAFPEIDTDIRHDASATVRGSSFSAEDTLRAENSQLLPGFELDLNTGGLGRYVLEYYEFRLRGADFLREPVFFDAVFFPRGVPVRSRYEFRTLNLSAILALPLLDFVDIDLRASIRYVDFYTSISAPTAFRAADDRTSTIVPTIGGGAEFFVLDQVYLFGSFQTLGYSVDGKKTSKLLFLDDDSNVFTRDWRLGVRWELLSFASISLEWRSLALRVKKGKARHRQDIDGFILSLEIGLF